MKQYVGLDVSREQTAVCIVNEHAKTLWCGKCASTPEAIAAAIKRERRMLCGLAWKVACYRPGTGTNSRSLVHLWSASMLVMPKWHSLQVKKTDPNDALG